MLAPQRCWTSTPTTPNPPTSALQTLSPTASTLAPESKSLRRRDSAVVLFGLGSGTKQSSDLESRLRSQWWLCNHLLYNRQPSPTKAAPDSLGDLVFSPLAALRDEQGERYDGDPVRTSVCLGAGVEHDHVDAVVAELVAEPVQVRDMGVVDG